MTQNHPKKGPRSLQDARSPENRPTTHENPSQSLTEPHRSPSVTNPPRKRGTAAETAIVRHALLRKAAA